MNIYGMLGKEASSLVDRTVEAGEYIYDFDGSSLQAGHMLQNECKFIQKEIMIVLVK
ncbi:MAG: hypothetical protein IPH77_14600 [Ignavibacteria bacterium]|nr:hypothetical protein [Ignavibacteria bacterium]